MVSSAAGLADAARETGNEVGAAADALNIKAVTRAEGIANTAGCAVRETGNLRGGEGGEESYGGKSEGVHDCCLFGLQVSLVSLVDGVVSGKDLIRGRA